MNGEEAGLEGTLVLAPGESGLDARVRFLADALVIETSDGEREAWTRGDVAAEPYDTTTMTLTLGASRLYFMATDPLVFAEELQTFLTAQTKRRKRRSRRLHVDEPQAMPQTETASAAAMPGIDAPASELEPARVTAAPDQVAAATKAAGRRRRGRAECDHDYERHTIGGGITRSVCSRCRQVSIDLTGRFELTADPARMFTRRL